MFNIISAVLDLGIKAATYISGAVNGTSDVEKATKSLDKDNKNAEKVINFWSEDDVNSLFRN